MIFFLTMTFYKRNLFHEKYERSEFDYLLCINYNRLKIHIGGKYSVKIQSYDLFVIKRPTIVLATSYGAPPQFKSHLLLKLTDESGISGWGESTPLTKFTGETIPQIKLILEEELLPEIKGLDTTQIAEAHWLMNKKLPGNHAAKMIIDTAMYDLMAKELGIPLYQILGGKVRNSSKINRHLGIMSEKEAIEKAFFYKENGFTSIKMKVGDSVDNAVARVKAVRNVIGPECQLRIDANGGYTYPDAMSFIRKVYDCNLEMYEQLLPKEDFRGILRLKEETGIPVGADEAINSISDAIRYAEYHAADVFTLKLVKTGGLWPALKIAAIAQEHNIKCVVASTYDTQLNAAACLHLAVSLPNATIGNDLTCYATQPTQADTCHNLSGCSLTVGNEPGIGVRSLNEINL